MERHLTDFAVSFEFDAHREELEMEGKTEMIEKGNDIIGDQVHVETLWSVQPDLKNKFL